MAQFDDIDAFLDEPAYGQQPPGDEIDQFLDAPEPGTILGEFGKGLIRGVEGVAGGIGSAARWLGDVAGAPAISKAGKTASEFWTNEAQTGFEAPNPETFRGTFLENPSFARAAGLVGQALPSYGAAIIASIATGSQVAGAAGLGLLEGAPQYEEARGAGKGVDEASVYGALSTIGTALLEGLPIGRLLKGHAGNFAVRGIKGGAEEAAQEATQTVWQNMIAKYGYDNSRSLAEGIVESVIAGFGTGAPVSSMMSPKLQQAVDDTGIPQDELDGAAEAVKTELQNADIAAKQAEPERTIDQVQAELDKEESIDAFSEKSDQLRKEFIERAGAGEKTAEEITRTQEGGFTIPAEPQPAIEQPPGPELQGGPRVAPTRTVASPESTGMKMPERKAPKAPEYTPKELEGVEIEVNVIEEETGNVYRVKDMASTAIADLDAQSEKYYSILECVG